MFLGPFAQASRALGENLVGVLGRPPHYIEGALEKSILHEITEDVAHRVHEHPARGSPRERLFEPLGAQERIKP